MGFFFPPLPPNPTPNSKGTGHPNAFGLSQLCCGYPRGTRTNYCLEGIICSDFSTGNLSWNPHPTESVFTDREMAVL